MSGLLQVLVVDDETPAREDLSYLLQRQPAVGRVETAGDAMEALRYLRTAEVDAVFLDIRMPGFDGMELARILGRFARAPAVVFVTAFETHAVDAFSIAATDYLLKPVGETRLRTALERILRLAAGEPVAVPDAAGLAVIAVDQGHETLMVERDSVVYVSAAGDYVRLHTDDGLRHLLRVPLQRLEEVWEPHGFARVHRQHLVNLQRVTALRSDGSGLVVCLGDTVLAVSRRHSRDLRARLRAHHPKASL